MIHVSEATKRAYTSDTAVKRLRVVFPELGLNYDNSSIETESLKLTEAISTKDSVEYVGCISSCLDINIYGINANIKGKKIEVYITADDTEEIPLFKGIVDSVVIDSVTLFKNITAYDALYTKGNTDVVGWYNQQFPANDSTKTVKELRDSLCNYIGLEQVDTVLPNDAVVIKKQYAPKSLKCINVLKSICQINGTCGIINRYGKLDYRYILPVTLGLFPGMRTFPSANTVPAISNTAKSFEFYETIKFEEYYVKPMLRVQIRDSDKDEGITVGSSSGNKYIIQANMLTYGLNDTVCTEVAQKILDKLSNVKFHPFTSKNSGLPFVEVGDTVRFSYSSSRTGTYATDSFTVLSRTLSGVQLLKDSYNAKGNEEQSEFITDLQVTLDTLALNGGTDLSNYYTKGEVEDYVSDFTYPKEDIDKNIEDQISKMETPTGFTVVSCYSLPANRDANTIYLVRGMVHIL